MFIRIALVILLAGGFAMAPTFQDMSAAAATKKKTLKKRSEYTPQQREKIMEEARKICKKRYGAGSRVHRLDYTTSKVWCEL